MARYLLIESRDPYESNDVPGFYELASDLARGGNEVTLFLVQNGVLATRGVRSAALRSVADAGVQVLADDFSLRERAIAAGKLPAGVKASPLDVVIDQLAEGRKAIWH